MRRQYPFHLIEPKWQQTWDAQQTFRAWNPGDAIPAEHPFSVRHKLQGPVTADKLPPKFYILDMFPYPSGAGLHVGHPEGYTATDILARYRRAQGYNVLHPMGWDAFGLPAEQYAIKTGQHPRKTTEANIKTFKGQIKRLGFSYDWSRELDTTDPKYFRWTQWIFLKLYNSYLDPDWNKATPIEFLEDALSDEPQFMDKWKNTTFLAGTHSAWLKFTPQEKALTRRRLIDSWRLAFVQEAPVWWCADLGTVLANEEVVDGKSEVGGFPVVRKPMRQWMLRITAYAERLLEGLDTIDWSDSLKEMQRNWIGRSEGARVDFKVKHRVMQDNGASYFVDKVSVFTTRPDTLFGATYMVLAPEHRSIDRWIENGAVPAAWPDGTPEFWKNGAATPKEAIEKYRAFAAGKSDLERAELSKEKTGVFSGVYAINPVNQKEIPIWIADYVLMGYGTGAIMAVPAHDERDWEFAKKFNLEINQVVVSPNLKPLEVSPGKFVGGALAPLEKPFCEEGTAIESPASGWGLDRKPGDDINFQPPQINNLPTQEAKTKIIVWLEEKKAGHKTINYKLRDWLFSRQRYWGEPFPIIWNADAAGNLYHEALPESTLPLLPPSLEDYKPTADGQPPLARAKDWMNLSDGSVRETNTMPQWAGSCWYYLRFLDTQNGGAFCNQAPESYWMGTSKLSTLNPQLSTKSTPGVDLYIGGVEHAVLHLLYARFWHKVLFDLGLVTTAEPFYKLVNQGLILGDDGQKMSKARGNVVNPDDIVCEYGADALRLYEMFMGPLEMVKPWNNKGVEGVYRFLGRVWRLFVDEQSETDYEQAEAAQGQGSSTLLAEIKLSAAIKDAAATPAQLKVLHACIKKVTEDLEAFRFNTAISALMVFVNEAIGWETKPVAVLKEFLNLLQPFAPHLAEELTEKLGGQSAIRNPQSTIAYAPWPKYDPALLVEDTIEMPIQINGKLRDKITVPSGATSAEIEAIALASEKLKSFLEGKPVKKVIIVPKRLVNIVA